MHSPKVAQLALQGLLRSQVCMKGWTWVATHGDAGIILPGGVLRQVILLVSAAMACGLASRRSVRQRRWSRWRWRCYGYWVELVWNQHRAKTKQKGQFVMLIYKHHRCLKAEWLLSPTLL